MEFINFLFSSFWHWFGTLLFITITLRLIFPRFIIINKNCKNSNEQVDKITDNIIKNNNKGNGDINSTINYTDVASVISCPDDLQWFSSHLSKDKEHTILDIIEKNPGYLYIGQLILLIPKLQNTEVFDAYLDINPSYANANMIVESLPILQNFEVYEKLKKLKDGRRK